MSTHSFRPSLVLLIFLLLSSPLRLHADDSVQYIGHYNPVFFVELLDVQVKSDTAYLVGVSDFSIVDVQDPSEPVFIGRYVQNSPPLIPFFDVEVGAGYAYGSSRFEGIVIFDLSDPAHPKFAGRYQEEDVAFESTTLRDTLLFAAARTDGMRIFSVADPETLVEVGSLEAFTAAWEIVVDYPWAYAADGAGGLKVIDVSDPTAPAVAGSLSTSGSAQDVVVSGDLAYLAVGGQGLDIVDISSPQSPILVSNYDTPGSAIGVAVEDSLAFIADWDGIRVVRVSDPFDPDHAGWEDTPVRAMGIDADGITAFVADWFTMRAYEYGPTTDADLYLPAPEVDLGDVEVGESADTTVLLVNTGGGTLTVDNILSSNPDFDIVPTAFSVSGSDTQTLEVSFYRSYESSTISTFTIQSDDPDEDPSTLTVRITDSNNLQEGELAPDFTLYDLEGLPHSLSDYRGQVVVLAFFASW